MYEKLQDCKVNPYRGSNMSAHSFFNLFNEMWKRDQMQRLLSISSLFRNELNKFNNTGTRISYSIYHMTKTLLKNCMFCVKT